MAKIKKIVDQTGIAGVKTTLYFNNDIRVKLLTLALPVERDTVLDETVTKSLWQMSNK